MFVLSVVADIFLFGTLAVILIGMGVVVALLILKDAGIIK